MSDWPDTKILIRPEEFRALRDLVHEHCGIFFRDDLQYMVTRRLDSRLKDLGHRDYTEYYRYLRYSPDRRRELERVAER